MDRVFLVFAAMIAALLMFATPASAQSIVRRGYEREHREVHQRVHVRVVNSGSQMQYGRHYDSISYGHRGLIALNFTIGGGGQRRVLRDIQPVREVRPGDCFVRVWRGRSPEDYEAEVNRETDGCFADALHYGDRNPRIVLQPFD